MVDDKITLIYIKDASDMLPSLGSKNNSLEDDLKSRLVKFHQNLLNFFDYLKILAALLDPSFWEEKNPIVILI